MWHRIAEARRWKAIPRYVAGITTVAVAFAAPVFAALPLETAATLYGLLWLIIGASGLATWLAYDADRPRMGAVDLDRLAEQISAEHES